MLQIPTELHTGHKCSQIKQTTQISDLVLVAYPERSEGSQQPKGSSSN